MQRLLLLFCSIMLLAASAWGQSEQKIPTGDLSTPKEAAFQHTYYQRGEHYDGAKSAKALVSKGEKVTEEAIDLANKLQQIFDGKKLEIRVDIIPDNRRYIDSISGNAVFVPFPKELPSIYLVRPKLSESGKRARYWRYSVESVKAIPRLHRVVYPLGSHLLVEYLPQIKGQFLGLKLWQYIAFLLLFVISFLLYLLFSKVFNFLIKILANSRLGIGHFDTKIVDKLAKLISLMSVTYIVSLLSPALMLPVGLSYYVLGSIRVFNTVFLALLMLNGIELGRSYFEKIVAETETDSDNQLLPIIIRTLKTVVVIGSSMQALAIFGVDVTALIAGLSIGGLAIALAAQETVKNLIGSVMIFADKPFKIGDFIKSGDFEGTVEDIGFRSTRIRTLDTSLVTVPNGSLVDMVIDNYGEMRSRRFKIMIGVTYYTPPKLIEKFIEGLKTINLAHPRTNNKEYIISLNDMGGSSLDILFIVYFNTTDLVEYLNLREEMIMGILKLAEAMHIDIAFPSTSVYIESMPERKTQVPTYSKDSITNADEQIKIFLKDFKKKYPNPDFYDPNDSE